ncbi:YtxH domain-containing protein [Dawidia soli]|uniref:YtxH domain-containing protein n=1 Tax=Dawidia soli TaxID=2782352 RepID=A0AAP2D794_9BACT|nr:YtxH domain-containing protein [Dawidia soli]MBT1686686.1 YtxH domain-containing protein [Dawidia soli]
MNTKSKIILGILGAAAAGAVIGMLVAPESGNDMRKKISKAATDFAEELTKAIVNSREQLGDAKNTILKEAKGLSQDAANRYSRVKESLS